MLFWRHEFYPVPMEETDGLGSSQFTPPPPPPPICFVSSTVHPIIPLERMDRLGSYQGVPLSTPCPYCPSYYISPRAHLAGCLWWFNAPLLITLGCIARVSIYRCENRLVVLKTSGCMAYFTTVKITPTQ